MLASARIAFLQSAPELVAAAIDALKNRPQPPHGAPAYASGKTARAIHAEATDTSLTLYGPQHIQALITGRKPTSPDAEAGNPNLAAILAQWAKDKGIQLADEDEYKSFGFALAKKIHAEGTALFRHKQPSGLFSDVLSAQRLDVLKARIAAGEVTAITTELQSVFAR
ncbi:hypothetical protein [Hymenobacter sp. GOD-10R]|uniref:hypothetical protein n=1 Tax=Hymenobacter sp. GOD-10R TaxID=3093922 RepID=UPI002D79E4AB|nr:hypothetical protein [Hymenobacter sp. GOD-10R]WRQ26683.1 hypothetical protein SD425_16545 [Hymenobacter sp. GOD-10R]